MNENQKKVTDEYRKNYDNIFKKKQTSQECIEADKKDKASLWAKRRKPKIAPEKKI